MGSGTDPLGAQRICKECIERGNRPISYENALLSFGSSINLTSRESVGALGELRKKIIHKIFWGRSWNIWGGGGGGGGGSFPPHWIEPWPVYP